MPDNPWYSSINISALDNELKSTMFSRVKSKFSSIKTLKVLGVSKGSLHNYLQGIRRVLVN